MKSIILLAILSIALLADAMPEEDEPQVSWEAGQIAMPFHTVVGFNDAPNDVEYHSNPEVERLSRYHHYGGHDFSRLPNEQELPY
jgi:hypothetical protein